MVYELYNEEIKFGQKYSSTSTTLHGLTQTNKLLTCSDKKTKYARIPIVSGYLEAWHALYIVQLWNSTPDFSRHSIKEQISSIQASSHTDEDFQRYDECVPSNIPGKDW